MFSMTILYYIFRLFAFSPIVQLNMTDSYGKEKNSCVDTGSGYIARNLRGFRHSERWCTLSNFHPRKPVPP